MPLPLKLDLPRARALALRAQGLDCTAPFGLGQEAALRAIEHLGYVQIDTISVVERAHHHVLWSRVPDYQPPWLDALQERRHIYEYWSHAASILPMRDFRHSLPLMRSFRDRFHWSDDTPELRQAMRKVLARIRREGALKLRDFESEADRRPGAWWISKIEKRAQHELAMRGTVMIAGREGFQKIFDLRDRVVPEHINQSPPRESAAADFLIERTLRAHGIAREAEIRYMQPRAFAAVVRNRLTHAVKKGRVVAVLTGDSPAYALPETLAQDSGSPEATEARILSPFDNFVIQRERLRWLFQFDYKIECYVPGPKRRYGHFVLPVLWGDRFAARLEAKAVRKDATLVLTGLWFEEGFKKTAPSATRCARPCSVLRNSTAALASRRICFRSGRQFFTICPA